MILNYFKIAFRSFWKHKLFTLINIVGLSIGISASLVIYLIVHFDLNFDKFHKDGDRIYRVVTNFTFSGEPAYNPGVCGPLPGAVKSQVSGLEIVAPIYKLFQPDVSISQNKNTPVKFKAQRNVILTDDSYFNLIEYKWLAGSAKTALNKPFQVVLTSEQAKLYFPNVPCAQILGKTVAYDTIKTTVTGIVETQTENTDFTFHDFISYSSCFTNNDLKAALRLHNWGGTSVKSQLLVKLYPNTKVSQIEKQLNDILKRNNSPRPDTKGNTQKFALQPLSDIHFNANYGVFDGGHIANQTTLIELLTIAVFLLLLGCINFVNLTTAQAAQRAKEIGIRKTMGSSRQQLIFQFLSETFFITTIAVIISAAMAPAILKLFAAFIPAGINADLIRQPGIILFLCGLTILVSLLSGFYPAIVLSGYKPVLVLKNQAQSNSSKTRSAWLRKSLTVTQFIIAQFFIMATVLVSKQIYYAVHKELGFKKDAIIVINSPYKNRKVSSNLVFLNKLHAMPQVEMVSMGNDPPSSENTSSTEATYRDGKKEIKMGVDEKFGDENYIKLYKIKLLAGRNLQTGDAKKAFLINAAYSRILGFKDPHDAVGKMIDDFNGDTQMQIVGVVSDFHQESLHAPIDPLIIQTSADTDFSGTFHIALKQQSAGGQEWKTAITAMESSWKEIYPEDDFEYHFIDETVAKFYESEQHTSQLLAWATGLSIFISCLGLLGLAIYTTSQRTKEIGVRKVLGATVAQIVTLLSTELIWLILLAFIIVTPMAWYAMNKWMQSFADRTPISWWIFALSGSGMLIAAVFTSSFQTVKAAIADPSKSLRSE
ncbi:ABC transporter permease [Mucilaginibacter sp.]|uniref:ABC transporter permease n=1 Tax=Mucilaginibacter sp. TaxID=1882438 RepID=UPI003D0B2EC7